MKRPSFRLRGKLILSFSAVVAVLTVALGAAIYVTFVTSLRSAHVSLLAREADSCVAAVEGVLRARRAALGERALRFVAEAPRFDVAARAAFLASLVREADVVGAAAVDARGQSLAGFGRQTASDREPIDGIGMTRDGGVLLVFDAALPAGDGVPPSALRIVLDVPELGARVARAPADPRAAVTVRAPGRTLFAIGPVLDGADGDRDDLPESGPEPGPSPASSIARHSGGWLVAERELGVGGWTVSYAVPVDLLETELVTLKDRIIAAALVTFWVAIWIVLIVANRISEPLRRLARAARNMDSFTSEAAILSRHSRDEIGDLGRALQALQLEVQSAVTRDSLTDVFNRRFLLNSLDLELARAQRGGYSVACMMLDLDRFKRINDACGHQAGDAVLVGVAQTFVRTLRTADIVARYGGEEFVVVCAPSDGAAALVAAERLRRAVERATYGCDGFTMRCTVSVGIAVGPVGGETGEQLIGRADEALYASKRAGRNRVTLAGCAQPLEGKVTANG